MHSMQHLLGMNDAHIRMLVYAWILASRKNVSWPRKRCRDHHHEDGTSLKGL